MDKIALITGAGSGIGRAAALALSKAGFAIILAGRRKSTLDATVAELPNTTTETLPLTCDVAKEDDVDALFDKVESLYGRLDVLFNNAGLGLTTATIDEIDVAEWRHIVDVNLTGSFLCARRAFALMRKQSPMGGRIINNGSISAHAPRPGSAPYTATKHAITGLTKTISLDGRAFNIACSQIDIGNASTEMAKPLSEGAMQAHGELVPEPLMDVHHVGEAIAQMASMPLDANIQFMTLMATKMPFVGRG